MPKIIVAGSRTYRDYAHLCAVLDWLTRKFTSPVTVICGMAPGADLLGRNWARSRGHGVMPYPADWSRYGPAAGPIRNEAMLDAADGLVAFWDRHSSGTKHMIKIAKRAGLRVYVEYV